MTLAKKSIGTIGIIVAAVVVGSFAAARLTRRKTIISAEQSLKPSNQQPTLIAQPFFYNAVGLSDPDAAQQKTTDHITRFTLDIRSCTTRDEAESLLSILEKSGVHGFYTPVRQGDHVVYHVRVGIFTNEDEARQMASTLKQKARLNGLVSRLQ